MLVRFPHLPALLARFLDGARAVWPGLWALMGDSPAGPGWAAAYTVCYRGGRLLSLRFPLSTVAAEQLFLLGLVVLVPDLIHRVDGTAAHILTAVGLLLAGWGHTALARTLGKLGMPASHLAGGLAGIVAVVLMPLSLGWPWLMMAAAAGALAANLIRAGTEEPPGSAVPGLPPGASPTTAKRIRPFVRLVPLVFNIYYFTFATYLPLEFARRGSPLLAGVGFAIGWAPSLVWHWLAPLAMRWPPYRVMGGAALLLIPATFLISLDGPWWWLAVALAAQALVAGGVSLYPRLTQPHEEASHLYGVALGEITGPILAGLLWYVGQGDIRLHAQVAAGLAAMVAVIVWAMAPVRWSVQTTGQRQAG